MTVRIQYIHRHEALGPMTTGYIINSPLRGLLPAFPTITLIQMPRQNATPSCHATHVHSMGMAEARGTAGEKGVTNQGRTAPGCLTGSRRLTSTMQSPIRNWFQIRFLRIMGRIIIVIIVIVIIPCNYLGLINSNLWSALRSSDESCHVTLKCHYSSTAPFIRGDYSSSQALINPHNSPRK